MKHDTAFGLGGDIELTSGLGGRLGSSSFIADVVIPRPHLITIVNVCLFVCFRVYLVGEERACVCVCANISLFLISVSLFA